MAEESQRASETQTPPAGEPKRGITLEIIGELLLLVIVAGMFTYLFIESLEWPLGSALMPRIAVIIGAPFVLIRVFVLMRQAQHKSSEQIMDLGFRTGADPKGERMRFFRICAYILGLYLAIWLLGFHIAVPLGVSFYMYVWGRTGFVWAAFVGLLFLALILGVYDHFLGATWHEPPLLQMFWG